MLNVKTISNMKLDEEMKIWEDRSNDEFGKILKAIKELTKDYFYSEEDENGIKFTPISNYITEYSLDGNHKITYARIYNVLENWDILDNDEGVNSLVKELKEIAYK